MKTIASALLAASVLAAIASAPASAASNGRDRSQRNEDCVVTGWTNGSWTRPIFKCPDENEHHGQRDQRSRD